MKKIKALAVVCLLVVLPVLSLRTCERSRMTKGLAAESRKLDALLDKDSHDDFSDLGLALNAYLAEAKYVLCHRGLLFGNYFSRTDKQIIFSNVSRRLLRVKEVILTNPGLIKSEPPNLDFTVDKFFEHVGTSAHLSKDRDLEGILKNWTDSGVRESIYITKDERDQHRKRLVAVIEKEAEIREQALAEKAQRDRAANRPPDIPGLERVQEMKQREVVRVSRRVIPFEKLDQYLGQKMTFTLKNGRQIVAKYSAADLDSLAIDFSTEGSPLVMRIPLKEIDRIEMVAREKVLEMYDPAMERESTLKPGFGELIFLPYPKSSEYVGFVTIDDKMVFISSATGVLTCHSQENAEGYKPAATRLAEESLKDLQAILRSFKKESELNLVFELRLIKEMPGASAPIIIYCKDLVLNPQTIRSMFKVKYLDNAMGNLGNPRYGKGERPWEYELLGR
jgi:hypothetical protein